jgi:hypothetical protein
MAKTKALRGLLAGVVTRGCDGEPTGHIGRALPVTSGMRLVHDEHDPEMVRDQLEGT